MHTILVVAPNELFTAYQRKLWPIAKWSPSGSRLWCCLRYRNSHDLLHYASGKNFMLTADRWWSFLCLIIVLQCFLQVSQVLTHRPTHLSLMCVQLVTSRSGVSMMVWRMSWEWCGPLWLTKPQLASPFTIPKHTALPHTSTYQEVVV